MLPASIAGDGQRRDCSFTMKALVLAYAKLNLSLEVVGLRSDGLHEIRSIVQTIDLADRIQIASATGIHVSCSKQVEGINIAEHAVRALLRAKKITSGVCVSIEKAIPIGAGLGGGSSDAAAVLATVNRFFPPVLADGELLEIAGSIGADVALFLCGGCVVVGGAGDPKRELPVRQESFVVLVPDIHCSTRAVYRAWRPAHRVATAKTLGRNDLHAAAVSVYPELEGYRDAIRQVDGLYSGMTGSGSAFFAAFASRADATRACKQLTGQGLGTRVYCCQPTKTGFAELSAPGTQRSVALDSLKRGDDA